jgi:tetratricopeptide (TPR) repeat protein
MSLRRELAVLALIVSVTFAVYLPIAHHEFIDFDDPAYIFNNPHVRGGLSWDGLSWALTTNAEANWTPLTWLSHMADSGWFGVEGNVLGLPASGWHHLVNLCLHAVNSVLLYLFLRAATLSTWRSAFVAAFFALHPLHVESVAWASERKDTLSTLFGFACLLAYVRYARRPCARRYALVFVLLGLGLMAKPMLVTWPFLMLLLDAWPLRRARSFPLRGEASEPIDPPPRTWASLILEKAPLFVLVAVSCVITRLAHHSAMLSAPTAPVLLRLQNAIAQYSIYVARSFWPADLAVLYPFPGRISVGLTVAASLSLATITLIAVWAATRSRPYVLFGWLWFLGTLVPVIGLVQVALHARADRYTYVPLVGLSVAVVWGGADLATRWPRFRWVLVPAGLVALSACAVASGRQVHYWSDTITLFRHTCSATRDNGWAHRILGTALSGKGRTHEAIPEYLEALRLWPGDPIAHNNLGSALEADGRSEDAIREYREAVRLDPDRATYRRNLERAVARSRPGTPTQGRRPTAGEPNSPR